jgi:ubiquinone/menaquinone biosynthesis C-methylase UbiE
VDDTARSVAAAYDRIAPGYRSWADAVTPPLRDRYAQRLIELVDPGAAVLEIGCGPGVPVAASLARRFDVTGVDVSTEMVSRAAANVPGATFIAADIRDVEFPPDSFRAVIALYSLIHVPRDDHPQVLAKVFTWLCGGGYFVASLGAHDLPEGRESDWLGGGEMTWSFFDADTNRRMLEETGFELEEALVIPQEEPDGVAVEFLWVVGRKPSSRA